MGSLAFCFENLKHLRFQVMSGSSMLFLRTTVFDNPFGEKLCLEVSKGDYGICTNESLSSAFEFANREVFCSSSMSFISDQFIWAGLVESRKEVF